MIALGFALFIIAYALEYTAVNNLMNGGQGPKFLESLGLSSSLSSPGTDNGGGNLGGILGGIGNSVGGAVAPISTAPQGSSNQIGQPPTSNTSPAIVVNPSQVST